MNDNKNMRDENPIKMFGLMIPSMPSLMFRLGGTFLRFKRNANKAGKVFKKELIKQGLDKKTASELTQEYLKGSHISQYIQTMGR